MRVPFDYRSAGYPIAIVMLLVGMYCAFVGSDWAAGGLGLVGVALLAIPTRSRGGPPRRAGG